VRFKTHIFSNFSNYRLKVVKEKAFMISQVLEESKVDASASGLGLDGFKKLLAEAKKPKTDQDSGKRNERE
jgi:hypothetical protein